LQKKALKAHFLFEFIFGHAKIEVEPLIPKLQAHRISDTKPNYLSARPEPAYFTQNFGSILLPQYTETFVVIGLLSIVEIVPPCGW
jgi:hypothetical protein